VGRRGEDSARLALPATPATRLRRRLQFSAERGRDALLFSSAGAAAVAFALTLAASPALGVRPHPAVLGLAFAGTLLVYNVDRLRDLQDDRLTAPERSAFVRKHGGGLAALAALAGLAAGGFALALGPIAWVLCGTALALGLLHRRLKHLPGLKTLYVTGAWLAVVVGLPALTDGPASPLRASIAWVSVVYGLSIGPNLMVSNLRDSENRAARASPRAVLRLAGAIAACGLALALLAPGAIRPLACVPLAELGALACYRTSERYGLAVVDGALALGGLAAFALSQPFG